MTPRRSPLFTRRRVLTGLGVGFVATGVSETGAFESVKAPRTSTVQVAGNDQKAILALHGFNESETYDSSHGVTVTNKTGTKLSGDPNNTVSSANGKLEFRPDSTESSSQTLKLDELSKDRPGKSQTFEIVTASGYTGDVSDDVTLSYANPDEISIEATRNITVSTSGLVYVAGNNNNDIRVYNPVKDEERSPPNSTNPAIISGSAADFTARDNAGIAFAPSEDGSVDGVYSTEVNADSENKIKRKSPSGHNIWSKNARFALAMWPGFDSNDNVSPNEWAIVYANGNGDGLYAMNAGGDTEEFEINSLDKGTIGAAGVADFSGNGKKEMVFLDSNKQFRYLEQNGDTTKLKSDDDNHAQAGSISSFGPPASFGDSTVSIPFINGSGKPSLVYQDGNWDPIAGDAKKAPCAPFDVDDDGELEFVFINSNEYIAYIEDVGGENNVKLLEIGERVNDNAGPTPKPDPSVGVNSGPRTN